jgi:hypothetical protein
MINILVVLGLSKEIEVIKVGLKVHLFHYLRLIVRTILQLFFGGLQVLTVGVEFIFEFFPTSFFNISLKLCV